MIDGIEAHDIALIRDARLEPSAHLTVITGETGAGKSALLSSLKLLVGERADASMVAPNAERLRVAGRIFRSDDDSEGIVVERTVGADGRSRVSIDGSMSTVGTLADLVGSRVDLCGQHEHQRLMNTASHVHLLDAWAGDAITRCGAAYREAFDAALQARKQREQVEASLASDERDLEEARFIASRIDEVAPEEGEYEQLLDRASRYEHVEQLAVDVREAYELLMGGEAAVDSIARASSVLERMASLDRSLSPLSSTLRDLQFTLEDASRELASYRDSIDYSPEEATDVQSRIAAIQGLMRAYGPTVDDVLAARKQADSVIHINEDGGEVLAQARRVEAEAEARLVDAATHLAAARDEARPRFAAAVNAYLDKLEMAGASMSVDAVELDRERWTEVGSQRVTFLFAPVPDAPPAPLSKIASGGEISRVMLAIKAALGAVDDVDTLVFDEVDAGVGGTAAVALGDVLADLARTHQVIVVTHLAQVAVMADVHYSIEKHEDGGVHSVLDRLDESERIGEIARMLSGEITTASTAHAAELLQSAFDRRPGARS